MNGGDVAFAVTAGMVATVNPCGFALLPAYLSAFVGLDNERIRAGSLTRAVAISVVLTVGFIAVFGIVGVVVSSAIDELQTVAPWFTIGFGVILCAGGIWLLTGRDLVAVLPKFERGGSGRTLMSMFLFGCSYAIASLSCALPAFLVVTSRASSGGSLLERLGLYVLYGVGMGVVVLVLTVAAAMARSEVAARFRSATPAINRAAGALMLLAGGYVAYYGWFEIRVVQFNDTGDDRIYDRGAQIQQWIQTRMPTTTNYMWFIIGALAVLVVAAMWSRSTGSRPTSSTQLAPDPQHTNKASDDTTTLS